ncbi:MAG: group 1 truncated hemoglobin [Proteobacteria bacterium]|nr:MAG: group 1 truncated hemoglobin [Pseudomonadota bacterium]
MKQSLFDAIGGIEVMEHVHTVFYDKVYAHPWLGNFFMGHDQKAIELRQTQFMAEKMGSEKPYPGRELPLAHRRMYITKELLETRKGLLREALEEEGLSEALILRWLKIDGAFWGKIKNKSLEEFRKIDLKYELPLIVERPSKVESTESG